MEISNRTLSYDQLVAIFEQMPGVWYENKWLIVAASMVVPFLVGQAEPLRYPDFELQISLAIAYLAGRILDQRSTLQAWPVLQSANQMLPPNVRFFESAGALPDDPHRRDFFRWPVAVGEGVALGLAFTFPQIALGIISASVLAAFNNFRKRNRAELILAEAERH